jgi:hypothetical protein
MEQREGTMFACRSGDAATITCTVLGIYCVMANGRSRLPRAITYSMFMLIEGCTSMNGQLNKVIHWRRWYLTAQVRSCGKHACLNGGPHKGYTMCNYHNLYDGRDLPRKSGSEPEWQPHVSSGTHHMMDAPFLIESRSSCVSWRNQSSGLWNLEQAPARLSQAQTKHLAYRRSVSILMDGWRPMHTISNTVIVSCRSCKVEALQHQFTYGTSSVVSVPSYSLPKLW